ncbi:MAG: hypothetical protein Q8J62_04380 [Candidatus Cloacimonadaceae bacterium]|nr:hypothetical protein [Candidatus Cloacimonadaceae bacterium]
MKFVLAVMSILMLAGACSNQSFDYPARHSDPTKETILIGILKGADSNYKRGIIKQIDADFADDFNVEVISIKNFKDIQDRDYAALLVMEQVKAGLLLNHGMKDIAKKGDKKNTIFIVSAGNPKWKWKREDVKVITSATRNDNPNLFYQELKIMLERVLEDGI